MPPRKAAESAPSATRASRRRTPAPQRTPDDAQDPSQQQQQEQIQHQDQPAKARARASAGSTCLTCRTKHRKCGQQKPVCQNCQKAGADCQWPDSKAPTTTPAKPRASRNVTKGESRVQQSKRRRQSLPDEGVFAVDLDNQEAHEPSAKPESSNAAATRRPRKTKAQTLKQQADKDKDKGKGKEKEEEMPTNDTIKEVPQANYRKDDDRPRRSAKPQPFNHSGLSPSPDSGYSDLENIPPSPHDTDDQPVEQRADPTASGVTKRAAESVPERHSASNEHTTQDRPSPNKKRKLSSSADQPLAPNPVTPTSPSHQDTQMKDTPVDPTESTLQKADGLPIAAASASGAANTSARNLPSSIIASPPRHLESSPATILSTTQPRSTSARKPVRSLSRPSITPRNYTTKSRVAKLNRGYSSSEDDDDEQPGVRDSAVKAKNPQRESSVASSQGHGGSCELATPSPERPAQQPNPPLSFVPQTQPDSPETETASNSLAGADTTEISAKHQSEEAVPPVPIDTTKDETASDTPAAADTTEASARQQYEETSRFKPKAKLSRSQRRQLARVQAEAQPGPASSLISEHSVNYREHTPSTIGKPEQSGRPLRRVAASPASSSKSGTHTAAAHIAEANEQPLAEVSEHPQAETIGDATSDTIKSLSQPAPSTTDVQYPSLSDSGEHLQRQVQSTENSQIAGAHQSPTAGEEEQIASVRHESSIHDQTPPRQPEVQQAAPENVTDEVEATGTPDSANASDAAVSSPEIPDASATSASRAPNNTDAMQQIMDRLLEADVGPNQSSGESSDEEAELDINPHYRMMLSDNMKTQSLPADGIAWGPDYRVHGSGREFVLYQRKGGDNYDELVDEEGNNLGDINNPPWDDLTYAGARQYEVYRRLGMKDSEGARYHRNHMVNSTSRCAWVQQYVDRLNIPVQLMEQLASFTEEDFWEDYTPYLMNHHSLIPLFDRYPNPDDYELPGHQCPLGDIREFLGANPVTMDIAARAMRSFICLAIGSLQRFPHDYGRAAQFFNVARSARDILYMCEPSLIAQAMVLSVQYFIMLMQYDEAWVVLGSAIRICERERWNQYNGTRYLPREPREERRRLWWACVLLERHLALQTGLRPVSSFKSDTPWPSRQTYTVADDYRDPPWDLMTAYPDPLDVMEEDDGRLKAASVTFDFTDSFFFKLYLEQASFVDPIMEIEQDLRSDGDITTALEKLAAFDLNKLAKLEADMAAYKKKVPNHYDALSTFDKNLMSNDACVTQALILTWWWHYLRLRLCRPFYAIALADAIHDRRPANPERPKPSTRLDGNPSGLHHSIVKHYTLQCLETTTELLEVGSNLTLLPNEHKITPVLPRHVLLPVLYEAAKMAILSNCIDRPEKMTRKWNEDVDYAIMLLTEYYAPPPVGQRCGADLDEMRKEVDKLVRDDGTMAFKFPSPALMESSPYDLKESRTLP